MFKVSAYKEFSFGNSYKCSRTACNTHGILYTRLIPSIGPQSYRPKKWALSLFYMHTRTKVSLAYDQQVS